MLKEQTQGKQFKGSDFRCIKCYMFRLDECSVQVDSLSDKIGSEIEKVQEQVNFKLHRFLQKKGQLCMGNWFYWYIYFEIFYSGQVENVSKKLSVEVATVQTKVNLECSVVCVDRQLQKTKNGDNKGKVVLYLQYFFIDCWPAPQFSIT